MERSAWGGLLGAAVSLALCGAALAQSTVKIGAIYPLSGVAASAGVNGRAAIEVALDIINNAHPELAALPLAKNAGLAGLGGAKVQVVFPDNHGTPSLTGDSVAANLTERGFKWFFRTTPIASDFARIYMAFLKDMKQKGAKTDTIAIVHENTEYGTSVASVVTSIFKENGLNI